MVEHATMRVLHAPTLGWRNVDIAEPLSLATGLRVQVENSGRACALAQLWAHRAGSAPAPGDLVFISVSDGIGVGVMMNGDVLRGRHNIAGEFGHTPLSLDGPPCSCGSNGCWEAYISNRATLARYFGRPAHPDIRDAQQRTFTVDDLIARARGGDAKAIAALEATARYLGLGLASVVNVLDPACVCIGGEITAAWDLIEGAVRAALAERALTPAAARTEIRPVPVTEHPRLQGAAALVSAPAFAAPVVA
jgi:predicted NBD/HSP70 family sugar kinase